MDAFTDPSAPPATAPEPPDLLQGQVERYRIETATTFRALQGVAGQIAAMLESGTTVEELASQVAAFERLQRRAGDELMCLGAALGSCGTA